MKYSIIIGENDACAFVQGLAISTKTSVEVCRALQHKSYSSAKALLGRVVAGSEAVPFLRYKHNVGHRRGPMAAGRFPKMVSASILGVLESCAANAVNKGLAVGNLVIKHISAHKGPKTMHYGRHRGKAKRTHIEIVMTEAKKAEGKKE